MRLLSFALILVLLFLVAPQESAAMRKNSRRTKNLTIQIDFRSARAVIDLLNRAQVGDAELDAAALSGNRQLIKKVFGDDLVQGRETFKKTLRQIIEGQPMAEDPFDWQNVKQHLPEINLLIEQIERNQPQLLAETENIIAPYTPADLKIETAAVFLVGGGSLGFAFSDDPDFYVGLHKAGGDYEGLKYLIAHELYHSIQQVGVRRRLAGAQPVKRPENIAKSAMLVDNVYLEGTATFVGNPLEANNLKQFGQARQDEYRQNRE